MFSCFSEFPVIYCFQHMLHFLPTTAGWKLSPMVGAMYSPELYTGKTTRIIFILENTDGDKMYKVCGRKKKDQK